MRRGVGNGVGAAFFYAPLLSGQKEGVIDAGIKQKNDIISNR